MQDEATTSADSEFMTRDVFDVADEAGRGVACRLDVKHSRACKRKGTDSFYKTVASAVALNPTVLTSATDFVRRPANTMCWCPAKRYVVTLSSSTVSCHGCSRRIKSSNHVCATYDLFPENAWLGKHLNPIYEAIARKNFVALSDRLPYRLPDEVIATSGASVSSACQSIVFTEPGQATRRP